MKYSHALKYGVIITGILALLASIPSCSPENHATWVQIGQPLNLWTVNKRSPANDTLVLKHPYANGGIWSMEVTDSSIHDLNKVCLMAPDQLTFELALNNKVLIKCEPNTVWPFSFSTDSIAIYPCDSTMRPYVIDPALFQSAWTSGTNNFSLRIKGRNIRQFDAGSFAIYGEVKHKHSAQSSPVFTKNYYEKPDLPTVSIQAENNTIPNEPKVKGHLSLICNNAENCEEFSRDIRIEIRGFSSSSFDKKQYGFTIAGDSTRKEKVSPLGLNPSRKWILSGPYSDPSLIRNALLYSLWEDMGYWAPHYRFVELVLNGTYQGVYLIMEKVEVNKSRLQLKVDTVNPGAFLVQLNRRKENDDIVQVNEHMFILSDMPGMNIDDAYRNYVKNRLEKFCMDIQDPLNHPESIDANSLADFMLVQEMVKNVDAYKVSTWFYKNDQTVDERVHVGPIWDFDLSIGSSNILHGDATDAWIYPTDKSIPKFFSSLFEDPEFKPFLAARYKILRRTIWSQTNLEHKIDSLVSCIGSDAIQRNFQRFPVLGREVFNSYHKVPQTHADEIIKMKQWLERRLQWMDQFYGT